MKKRAATSPTRTLPRIAEHELNEVVLTTAQLLERVPLRRQTIWRMVQEGRFPPPIRLTASRLGWRWSTVLAWLSEREKRPVKRRQYFPKDDNTKSA
jgi:prophage regulatory protein